MPLAWKPQVNPKFLVGTGFSGRAAAATTVPVLDAAPALPRQPCGEILHPRPNMLQSLMQPFCAVFQLRCQVITLTPCRIQGIVIARAVLPIKFIYRENIVGVESPPVQLPKGNGSPTPTVAVGKWVDCLEMVMQDCRTQHRRKLDRSLVPLGQQFKHQAGNVLRGRGQVSPLKTQSKLWNEAAFDKRQNFALAERLDCPSPFSP